ncbi:MAG TPA: hypothetical protein VKV36_09460 [Acidimicrobiales bacterium]|nr:hypothetical protein [Acidimicrobiales bacterium]
MQSGDQRQPAIATMPDVDRFDGGIPAALLLIESAHQEIDPVMDLSVGMRIGAGTGGALALMDITLRHGLTLPEVSSVAVPSYQKPGT